MEKQLHQILCLNKTLLNFIEKETLAQVLSCEFWENICSDCLDNVDLGIRKKK